MVNIHKWRSDDELMPTSFIDQILGRTPREEGKPRTTPRGHELYSTATPRADKEYNRKADRTAALNRIMGDQQTHFRLTDDGRILKRRISNQQYLQTGQTLGPGGNVITPPKWGLHERRNAFNIWSGQRDKATNTIAAAHQMAQNLETNKVFQGALESVAQGQPLASPNIQRRMAQYVAQGGDPKSGMDALAGMERGVWQLKQAATQYGPMSDAQRNILRQQAIQLQELTGEDLKGFMAQLDDPGLQGGMFSQIRQMLNTQVSAAVDAAERKRTHRRQDVSDRQAARRADLAEIQENRAAAKYRTSLEDRLKEDAAKRKAAETIKRTDEAFAMESVENIMAMKDAGYMSNYYQGAGGDNINKMGQTDLKALDAVDKETSSLWQALAKHNPQDFMPKVGFVGPEQEAAAMEQYNKAIENEWKSYAYRIARTLEMDPAKYDFGDDESRMAFFEAARNAAIRRTAIARRAAGFVDRAEATKEDQKK